MLWINFKRVFHSGFINFWRMPVVALASIVPITVTLFVAGGLWLGSAFLTSSLAELQNKVDISVSFKPDTKEADVVTVQKSLEALPEVASVSYRSREQELEDFRTRNADNDLIIRSLDEVSNPFGARLNITAVDPAHYAAIAKFLDNSGNTNLIDQVSFKKNVIDKLARVISVSRTLGLAVTCVLIFLSLMVTINTITLAIYVSREEISLMKLVGAGNNYVRGPFLVQGLIAGVLAAFLSTVLLYPGVLWVRNQTAGVYGGVDLVNYFVSNFAYIFLSLVLVGALLGVVSSYLAIRRHLRT